LAGAGWESDVKKQPHRGKSDLQSVGDLVDGVVSSLGRRVGLGQTAQLWADWPDLAGPEWTKATPIRLEKGTLSVAVPDGMTATRLRYATGELIKRIDDRMGPGVVSNVRLQIRRPKGSR
jgi:hypothetical protein